MHATCIWEDQGCCLPTVGLGGEADVGDVLVLAPLRIQVDHDLVDPPGIQARVVPRADDPVPPAHVEGALHSPLTGVVDPGLVDGETRRGSPALAG